MQRWLGERFGSGDGERKTLLTRQIAFEPLPASVLFGLVRRLRLLMELIQNVLLDVVKEIGRAGV